MSKKPPLPAMRWNSNKLQPRIETDPDAWKQDWKPLSINSLAYRHLRCDGRPGYISLTGTSGKTNEQLDLEATPESELPTAFDPVLGDNEEDDLTSG